MKCWLSALFLVLPCQAHIGSPTVFYEGAAGPYPVRVTIRPPPVIPGLAEVSVRVNGSGVTKVTVLPVVWNTGRKGAPPPDIAEPVRGETNLYGAELWLMVPTAHSVYVDVTGAQGVGTAIVPVNAIATRRLLMSKPMGAVLGVMAVILVLLMLAIVRAATRESVLVPGAMPTRKQTWWANGWTAVAALAIGLGVWGGRKWWDAKDAHFRNNRLYQLSRAQTELDEEVGVTKLRLTREDLRKAYPVVPDHGKLMHLFVVREPGLDAFAHLHPSKLNKETFATVLPPLPEGDYRIYADLTYENGYAETLSGAFHLKKPVSDSPKAREALDSDDSWHIGSSISSSPGTIRGANEFRLPGGEVIGWRGKSQLVAGQPVDLEFVVNTGEGKPVSLEPLLGMPGHAVVRHQDGSVFAHIHPAGTISMAAQQLFELRAQGRLPTKLDRTAQEPVCQLPSVEESLAAWRGAGSIERNRVQFPYEFPKAGTYRIWVQVKVGGRILTAEFDVAVKPAT